MSNEIKNSSGFNAGLRYGKQLVLNGEFGKKELGNIFLIEKTKPKAWQQILRDTDDMIVANNCTIESVCFGVLEGISQTKS